MGSDVLETIPRAKFKTGSVQVRCKLNLKTDYKR
jgi:hypothetical protein